MPSDTTTDSRPAALLPVTIPAPAFIPLGDWHRRGRCAGQDPDPFFPANGDPATKARETCAACPVRRDCLQYATDADESGIWGGLDQQERRNLKRRQRRAQPAEPGSNQPGRIA